MVSFSITVDVFLDMCFDEERNIFFTYKSCSDVIPQLRKTFVRYHELLADQIASMNTSFSNQACLESS